MLYLFATVIDATALQEKLVQERMSSIVLTTLDCMGNESNLLQCSYNVTSATFCSSNNSAGVLCGGNH